ncbi:MAG: hypothetical protein CXZ00_09285 [Acidobacteria bacterium]|nr:MAG: hypothetical protein CXZ00_09285 [Acidobacteriota bacterium]
MTEIAPRERLVAAAVTLFARSGFNGITTKDIARRANVSEGNIFRYFPHKRDLFIAAVDSELENLHERADELACLASVDTPRDALRDFFKMVTDIIVKRPELVRLLQFGTLEFGAEMEPVYRRHIDALATAWSTNFKKWAQNCRLHDMDPQITVLSFVATVALLQNYRAFTGSALPFLSVESAAKAYAELWYRLLSEEPAADLSHSSSDFVGSAPPE